MPEPQMSFSSATTGQTQAQQIAAVLALAQAKQLPMRVRIPFSLYDHDPVSRNYVNVKDAAWNLALPSEGLEVAHVERLIHTIGVCMAAIAREGSERVLEKLERP